MRNIDLQHLVVVVLCLGVVVPCLCQDDSDDATTAVYIVALRHAPTSHYYGELREVGNGFQVKHGASGRTQFHKPRYTPFFHGLGLKVKRGCGY